MAERIYTSTGKVVEVGDDAPKKKPRKKLKTPVYDDSGKKIKTIEYTDSLTAKQSRARIQKQALLSEEEIKSNLQKRKEIKAGLRDPGSVRKTLNPGDPGFFRTPPSAKWDFKTFPTKPLKSFHGPNVLAPSTDIHLYQEGQYEARVAKDKALKTLLTSPQIGDARPHSDWGRYSSRTVGNVEQGEFFPTSRNLVNITTTDIQRGPHSNIGTNIYQKKDPRSVTVGDSKTTLPKTLPIADTSGKPQFLGNRELLLPSSVTMPKDPKEVAMRESLSKLRDEGGVKKSTRGFSPIAESEAGTLRQYLKTQVSQLAKAKSGKAVEGNYGSQAIRHIENRIVNYISKGNQYVDIPIEGFDRKIRGTKMGHMLAQAALNDPDIQSQMNPADKKLFGEFGGKGKAGFAGKSSKASYISEHWASPFGRDRSQVATEVYSLNEEKAIPVSSGSRFRPTLKKPEGAFNTKINALSGVELSPNPRLIGEDPGSRLPPSLGQMVMRGHSPLSAEEFTLGYQMPTEAPSPTGEVHGSFSGEGSTYEAPPHHTEIEGKILHTEPTQTKLSGHSGALQWTPQTSLIAGVSRSQLKHYYPQGTVLTVASPTKKVPLGTMSQTGHFIPVGLRGDIKKKTLAPMEMQSPEWKTIMQTSAGSGLYGQDVPEGYLYDDPQARAVQSATGPEVDAPHKTGIDIEEKGIKFSGLSTQTKKGRIADPARTGVVDMEAKQLMELDVLDLDAEETRLRKQQELNQKIMHEGNKITGQTEESSSDSRKKKLNELKKKGVKISHGDRHPSKYIDEGKARRAEIKQYSPELEREGVRRDSADLEGQERAWVRVKDKKGKESWKYRKITDKNFTKTVEIVDKKTGQKKLIEKIDYERHGSFKKVSRALRRQNVEIELANVKEGKPPDQGKKTFYQDPEGKFHVMDVQEAFERRQGTFKRPTPQVTGYNRQGTLVTSTAPKVEGNVASTSAVKETKTKAQKKWGVGSLRSKLTFGTNLFVLPDVIHALRVKKDTEKTGKEFNIGSFIPPYARKIVYGKPIPRS